MDPKRINSFLCKPSECTPLGIKLTIPKNQHVQVGLKIELIFQKQPYVVENVMKYNSGKNECSAVFGTEIWPAAEYGRTMYTIRQRVGPLLMKMQKRDGLSLNPLLSTMLLHSLINQKTSKN